MLCPVISKHFFNIRTAEEDTMKPEGSTTGLRPTWSLRYPEAVAMRYRVLNIGKGSANDLDLENFGHCNCIIPKHAVIFFDEVSLKEN